MRPDAIGGPPFVPVVHDVIVTSFFAASKLEQPQSKAPAHATTTTTIRMHAVRRVGMSYARRTKLMIRTMIRMTTSVPTPMYMFAPLRVVTGVEAAFPMQTRGKLRFDATRVA
jgi:hypothetical protein